ncbi:MAG: heavy metal translocating P-type ATPase, partial [Gammaproteobacteria bacterium]|nr:heavy metal translocating P-type ATPase [Gammaproteobacteria bacterium]
MNRAADCFHCGEPVPDGPPIVARIKDAEFPMCCVGCKAVAEFIDSSGLDAFYQYRDQPDVDLNLTPEASDWGRFDSDCLLNRYVHAEDGHAEATIDIGGMYCSACVWLFDNALRRVDGVESIDVNPATRRSVIRWESDRLSFSQLLGSIARVGFKPTPVAAGEVTHTRDDEYKTALKRLIVAAAAGMQVMMFAVALYAGDYFGIEGDIEKFLRTISLLVTVPIVFYSARPFFAGAWRGLQARAPGMDLPVSIAIGAAFIASTWATWTDSGEIYFDSVAMFVFFLSATRFLEMRARHRSDDHALALRALLPDTAIRVRNGVSETVLLDQLCAGDLVSIRPGDVLPADGEISEGELSVDESMLTGESLPAQRTSGDPVFAGALVRQGNAMLAISKTGASTSLAEIGRMLERAKADRPPIAVLADRVAGYFVVGVLIVTALAASAWTTIDPARAFEVALATLVVTCPCALALATPAAIAAATTRLARSGFLLVRSRILEVLNRSGIIVFDKTGTLTEGRPIVLRTRRLSDDAADSDTLLAIAASIEIASEHVLARAFSASLIPGQFRPCDINVVPGAGVEASLDNKRYRIGHAAFVAQLSGADFETHNDEHETAVYLGDEENVLARFDIGDELRSDAAESIRALQAAGYRTVIASGDRDGPVQRVAGQLGVD